MVISSAFERNRAIHGDKVAVELYPRSQWQAIDSRNGNGNGNGSNTSTVLPPDEEEAIEDSDSSDKTRVSQQQPRGRVVGLLALKRRPYVCTIQIRSTSVSETEIDEAPAGADPTSTAQERILVIPMDRRIPKIRITTRQTHELLNSRLVVRIDDWERTSAYPEGHYLYQLGDIGDIEAETRALLVEHEIPTNAFSDNALASLPPSSSAWSVTPDEEAYRRDLRGNELIMSVDPPGCQDIDDALSARRIKGGLLQFGVHIADVSHFVKEGSALDLEARDRGTSVYLADRRMDMLPAILSEQLCSIRGNTDRYAMSVMWKVRDDTLEVVDTWFGRTIIHSSNELDYKTAQLIVDDALPLEKREALGNYVAARDSLLLLVRMARHLRAQRLERGALTLESVEVKFEMDDERNVPKNISTCEQLLRHERE